VRPLPLLFALSISFGLGHSAEAESIFGPSAGELVVGTRPEAGETAELIHYSYAYGPTDGSTSSESAIVDGIVGSLPEDGEEIHVVDVFAEDAPADLAKGRRLVDRLRVAAKKLTAKYGHRAEKIEFDLVPVPSELAEIQAPTLATTEATLSKNLEAEAIRPSILREFRRAMVRPTPRELRTGAIVGTYRGITSFSTWFSTPGINPILATSIATFQTSLSTFHAVFARSMAGVFKINLHAPGGIPIRQGTLFARRQIYAVLLAEITRLITGTRAGFDPQFTWAGQAQIVSLSLAIGGLDSLFMGVRDRAFLEEPVHFARMLLANFFLLTPWQMMDAAGTFPVLLDLTVYKVRASTIGMLATYFGLYQSVRHAPGKVAFVLDSIFDPIERGISTIQRTVGKSCQSLLHVAEDFGDHFRDFVR
jgi:hypothetical protein